MPGDDIESEIRERVKQKFQAQAAKPPSIWTLQGLKAAFERHRERQNLKAVEHIAEQRRRQQKYSEYVESHKPLQSLFDKMHSLAVETGQPRPRLWEYGLPYIRGRTGEWEPYTLDMHKLPSDGLLGRKKSLIVVPLFSTEDAANNKIFGPMEFIYINSINRENSKFNIINGIKRTKRTGYDHEERTYDGIEGVVFMENLTADAVYERYKQHIIETAATNRLNDRQFNPD